MQSELAEREFKVEKLGVRIYENRQKLGNAAGKVVADKIRELLQVQKSVTMIFAAAPSQNEFLACLAKEPGIDWKRVNAYHMDEYVGLSEDAPQRFQKYLKDHLFSQVQLGQVNYLNGNEEPKVECERYGKMLIDHPVDICCMGIGENGHIAFNDPAVADFYDPKIVKAVALDDICRQQQVNDGCFSEFKQVPAQALTLTIPTLMSANYLYVMVPGTTKAAAVKGTLTGSISTKCPATILRTHLRAELFIDRQSSALIDK